MTRGLYNRGFTLVELVVVLAIMALVIALAMPYSARSGEGRRFAAMTRTLAAEMRNMKALAIARNRETVLSIDLENRTVSTTLDERAVVIPDNVRVTVLTSTGEVRQHDAGFRFFPDGTATGGRIILVLGEELRIVNVNWLTGGITTAAEWAK